MPTPPDKLLQAFDFAGQMAERSQAHDKALRDVLFGLLEVMDSFDRFAAYTSEAEATHENAAQWRATSLLIGRQLLGVLRQAGVVPIECVGQAADPLLHEIVETRPALPGEDGKIVAEIARGYTFNGQVLRQPRIAASQTKKENPT